MHSIRVYVTVLLCTAILSMPTQVTAEKVRHEFSGVITFADFRGDDPFNGEIQVGSTFTGFYEFDSDQQPVELDSKLGRWEYLIPPHGFEVMISSIEMVTPDDYIIIITNDDNGFDRYTVSSTQKVGGVFDPTGWIDALQFTLSDNSATAINDPGFVPIAPPT